MSVLAHLRQWLLAPVLYVLLLVLGLLSLGWNLIAMVLLPFLPAERGRRVGRAGITYGYRFFWSGASLTGVIRIDARCMDVLRDERGLIIVANHPTMLDALLLVARLPRSACIMKASLMKNAFLGAGARLARYIRNDAVHSMIKQAVTDLRQGGQLVVFPEATRTTQRPINHFGPAAALVAKLAQAPVQTVFIETDSPYLSKGWPIWRVPPLPMRFTLRLGERFAPPRDDVPAFTASLEQYFRAQLGAASEFSEGGATPPCPQARVRTSS